MLGLGVGLGYGGGPLWTPKTPPGLALWLRGDMGVTLNGAKVSAWADQSGAGDANRNATQATDGNRPTFVASDAAYNNKPLFAYVAANVTRLQTGTWTPAPPTQPYTLWVVGNGGGGTEVFIDGITSYYESLLYSNGATTWWYAGTFVSVPVTSVVPSVMCVVVNGASTSVFVRAKTAAFTGDGGAQTPTGIILGTRCINFSSPLNGKIAEVLVYAGAQSAADRSAIWDYLSARYGIAIGA